MVLLVCSWPAMLVAVGVWSGDLCSVCVLCVLSEGFVCAKSSGCS
jgi:hypothetical protein